MRTIRKFYELLEWDRMWEVHTKNQKSKLISEFSTEIMEAIRQWNNRMSSNSERTT